MIDIDRLIVSFDRGMRALFAPASSLRPVPGEACPRQKWTRYGATMLPR